MYTKDIRQVDSTN